MSKIEVIRTFFKEVWSNERAEVIDELFQPDTTDEQTADGLQKEGKMSPEDFKAFHSALLGLIKDVVITIEDDFIEKDEWVVSRCTLDAQGRKDGRPVQIKGSAWARITDGKIREAHNYFDFLHLFEGLGLLPKDTMMTCMQGQRIGVANKVMS